MPQCAVIPPDIDPDTRWWWDALREGRLLLPHCRSCDRYFFPPSPSCLHCGATDTDRREATGTGTIYSWIVVHIALDPTFAADVPYTVAAVQLEEGPRLFGRIANGPLEADQQVRAVPSTIDDVTVLGFKRL